MMGFEKQMYLEHTFDRVALCGIIVVRRKLYVASMLLHLIPSTSREVSMTST